MKFEKKDCSEATPTSQISRTVHENWNAATTN